MSVKNKFVISIIVNGVVQLESGSQVLVPFGVEYKVRLRNRHNRRAAAYLSIDGEEVGQFVVPANSFIDVERPVETAKKFKFVSINSSEAVDFGKNQYDGAQGKVEAVFYLEKEYVQPVQTVVHRVPSYPINDFQPTYSNGIRGISYGAGGQSVGCAASACNFVASSTSSDLSVSNSPTTELYGAISLAPQVGCTVEGSVSSQRFRSVHMDLEPYGTSIIVFLRGMESKQLELKETQEAITKLENKLKIQDQIDELKARLKKLENG